MSGSPSLVAVFVLHQERLLAAAERGPRRFRRAAAVPPAFGRAARAPAARGLPPCRLLFRIPIAARGSSTRRSGRAGAVKPASALPLVRLGRLPRLRALQVALQRGRGDRRTRLPASSPRLAPSCIRAAAAPLSPRGASRTACLLSRRFAVDRWQAAKRPCHSSAPRGVTHSPLRFRRRLRDGSR